MVFLFDVAGEKELSIPMILGGLLFLITRDTAVLIGAIAYISLIGIMESYYNALKNRVDEEKVGGREFFEAMKLLFDNKFATGSNRDLRYFRGLVLSGTAMILAIVYILYESLVYVFSSNLSTGMALVFYIGIIYSFYFVFNSSVSLFIYLIADKTLDYIFLSSEKEELTEFSFESE